MNAASYENITPHPCAELEYGAIERKREEAFLLGIGAAENAIDYLMGAYSLFPHLSGIPDT